MEEVDSFLELIREEMEELLRENANLREETKRLEKTLYRPGAVIRGPEKRLYAD